MTVLFSLRMFFEKGFLGGISSGASQNDVQKKLGDPDAKSDPDNEGYEIWKYQDFQVTFHNKAVCLLAISTFDTIDLPDNILPKSERNRLLACKGLQNFRELVSDMGVIAQIDPLLSSPNQTCLSLGIGVKAIFDSNAELETIQYKS